MDIEEQDKRFKEFKKNYSDKFLNEILDDLKVFESTGRQAMKESLFKVGQMYILRDNIKKMYIPAHKVKAKNEKIYKPLRDLKNKWKAYWKKDGFEYFNFYEYVWRKAMPFHVRRLKGHTDNQLIKTFVRHDPRDYNLSYMELMEFLDFIDFSSDPAYGKVVGGGIKGVTPIERWLRQLKPDWETYSYIEFTSGFNYGGSVGHNSEAVQILDKLMKCMDADVGKNTIGNTLERLIKSNWKKI